MGKDYLSRRGLERLMKVVSRSVSEAITLAQSENAKLETTLTSKIQSVIDAYKAADSKLSTLVKSIPGTQDPNTITSYLSLVNGWDSTITNVPSDLKNCWGIVITIPRYVDGFSFKSNLYQVIAYKGNFVYRECSSTGVWSGYTSIIDDIKTKTKNITGSPYITNINRINVDGDGYTRIEHVDEAGSGGLSVIGIKANNTTKRGRFTYGNGGDLADINLECNVIQRSTGVIKKGLKFQLDSADNINSQLWFGLPDGSDDPNTVIIGKYNRLYSIPFGFGRTADGKCGFRSDDIYSQGGPSKVTPFITPTEVPFKFGVDSNGNYGYYKDGADTVTPFKKDVSVSNIISSGTNKSVNMAGATYTFVPCMFGNGHNAYLTIPYAGSKLYAVKSGGTKTELTTSAVTDSDVSTWIDNVFPGMTTLKITPYADDVIAFVIYNAATYTVVHGILHGWMGTESKPYFVRFV